MKIRNITETTAGATSSGSVASVAKPLGKMQERTEVSGLHTAEKVMKGKTKKKGPYGNSLSESEFKSKQQVIDYFVKRGKTAQQGAAAWERGWRGTKKSTKPASDWMARWENDKQERENKLSEAELSEQDLIIVPGMRKIKDTSFIPHKLDRRDHEVEMARSEIYAAAKDAMRIFKLLKDRTEDQGIMGWQQSYITLASDYLNSVADSLDYDANVQEMTGGVLAGGMSNFEEGTSEDNDTIYNNWRKDLGTDYDTTLNLVDNDHNPNKPRNVADELAKMNKKLKGVAEGFEKKDMTGQTCEKCKKDKYQERSWNDDRNGTLQCSCGHVVDRWRKYKKKDEKQGVAEAAGSLTFAGKDPNEFQSPKGGKPVMVVVTDQGSRYLITSDGMVLRNKSAHANTGGEDAGLQAWSDKIEFYDRSKPLIAGAMQPLSFPDAVSNLFDKGRIALTKDAEGKRVALILDNSQWRPATIADAMPKAAASKPEWAKIVIKADAGTWGMQPKLGWQPLDYNQRGDGTLNRVHNGSPVSHGAKVTQGVAEGQNSSPWDQMAHLQSKSNKELDELVRFWQRSLEKNPNHKVANDQLHIIKMIRAERIGRKGVAEGSDVEYVVVIRDEHGKRSIRVSALTPTDAKEKAEAQGYKVIKVKDPREAHYFREQSVAEGKFTINAKTGAKLDPRTGAELPPKEKPLAMKDMFRQPKSTAPKPTLDDVWRKVEYVVGQIFPDGDPMDWLLPWFRKQGIADHKIGGILERAAKKNGYKDLYDYYDSMKDQYARDNVAEGFKNTYEVGDRVDGPLGTGTIVAVSKNINVGGRVKVKLDDPSRAGEDGKYKDSFILTTTQLKHISEQGVAETLDINSDSDDAKIEQLKKLLYLDRSHKKEFGSSAGLTQKQLAAARDEIRRLSTGQIQSKSTEKVSEAKCPKCGGPSYQDTKIAEEKDACYHKVKSRYKVWPSAYASGALVKCRKVGASNWGNKSKK